MNSRLVGPALVVAAGIIGLVLGLQKEPAGTATTPGDGAALATDQTPVGAPVRTASRLGPAPRPGVVQVFKSPTCGCCNEWVKHLEANGYTVEVQDRADMAAVKRELGLPGEMASCHTARIDGYVIEGHVPADDIDQLLAERPDVKGLAVPGMPVGSPGMEVEGQPADPYDVIAFDAAGRASVYSSYR